MILLILICVLFAFIVIPRTISSIRSPYYPIVWDTITKKYVEVAWYPEDFNGRFRKVKPEDEQKEVKA